MNKLIELYNAAMEAHKKVNEFIEKGEGVPDWKEVVEISEILAVKLCHRQNPRISLARARDIVKLYISEKEVESLKKKLAD